MIIIGLTGLPGSGKTTVADFLEENGFVKISCGDFVREEIQKRGLEYTRENDKNISLELTAKNEIPKRVTLRIKDLLSKGQSKIMVEGLRTVNDMDNLKNNFRDNYVQIAVHVPPMVRFERNRKRGRFGKDIEEYSEFYDRDKREISVQGIASVIVLSDHIVENTGTMDDLKKKSAKLLQEIKKEHKSLFE